MIKKRKTLLYILFLQYICFSTLAGLVAAPSPVPLPKKGTTSIHTEEQYLIAILVENPVKEYAEEFAKLYEQKYNKKLEGIPHISILQGKFSDKNLDNARMHIKTFCQETEAIPIDMDKKITNSPNGNTTWRVKSGGGSPSLDWVKRINKELSKTIGPSQLIRELLDILQQGAAYLKLEKKYGKRINALSADTPHITVVYGLQDILLAKKISKELSKKKNLRFLPKGLLLASIDQTGNLAKVLDVFPFSGAEKNKHTLSI